VAGANSHNGLYHRVFLIETTCIEHHGNRT
jgi:hypothetical protein